MILRAGLLFDGTLAKPRTNVDIVVDNGYIAEIRDASGDCDREFACIAPGLINAHVHLEMSGEPDALNAATTRTPVQKALIAASNARKALHAGVTTIRDLGCSHAVAMEVREAVNSGLLEGPSISASGYVLCMTGGHGWPVGRAIDSPEEAHKAVREQRHLGADCIKLIATGGVLTKGAVPGVSQLTLEEMQAACTEAHRHGMRVAAHAIGTQGINDALRAGVDSIEHGMLLDDESIELLKSRTAYLVPTLTAPACILEHAQSGGQPDYVVRKAAEISERMTQNLQRAFKAGVRFAGGSDAGTPFNYHDAYAEEVLLMQTQVGMNPREALHAATQSAGELIGTQAGVIEAGRPADLLGLANSIEDDLRTLRAPAAVFKGGIAVS
ncbi:MAG TPA: amidohydrolase family protein [Candidatus Baltobacteraceae bacterium]|nr:amidohydrolase family protein [Candidatus Baltobacteraceae bacterium]